MEKINGISFEDWAAASANVAQGMPIGQVLDILNVSSEDWEEGNKKWGEKMASMFVENPEISMKYAEIFQNPKVGKFANVELEGETPSHLAHLSQTDDDWGDDEYKSVKDFMREANGLQEIPEKAVEVYKKAIALIEEEDDEDNDYDNLYAHYFIMKHYQQQRGEAETKLAVEYAQKCLDLLQRDIRAGNIWYYTDEGQFQMEVIRVASNTVAWNKMLNTDDYEQLEEALDVIDLGIDYINDDMPSEYYLYLYDTKVRILLKMKETTTAYCWVYQVLEEEPDFSDFEDIKNSAEYKEWLKSDEFKKFLEELEEDDDEDDDDWD